MNISMIGCPFQTSFGTYTSSLKTAIEKQTGAAVQWVGSNCGCGDPVEVGRHFQTADCSYFDMPMVGDYRSSRKWKLWARGMARSTLVYFRARRYAQLSRDADVVHFHQILNAYGSKAVFRWLKRPSQATRIITVHELDADQLASPQVNQTYNRADAIIVHCQEMKDNLIGLGVQSDRIHIVLHGAPMPPLAANSERQGVVFYGGHKLTSGKGVDTLFRAMAMVLERTGSAAPGLKVHGHYGTVTPAHGLALARQYGLSEQVVWLNQLPDEDVVELYRHSALCVLPYTGSFAGYAASLAAACALPVVATRKAGLPDHLGDAGVWIDEVSPGQLAERIIDLAASPRIRLELGERLRRRAEQFLQWSVIAERTMEVYETAVNRSHPQPRVAVSA